MMFGYRTSSGGHSRGAAGDTVRGDRIVRLTFDRRCGAHEDLEVAGGRDAERAADVALDVAAAVGVRGLEVEELLDGRGGHGDSLRAATDTPISDNDAALSGSADLTADVVSVQACMRVLRACYTCCMHYSHNGRSAE